MKCILKLSTADRVRFGGIDVRDGDFRIGGDGSGGVDGVD